jgi:hypothetical protein
VRRVDLAFRRVSWLGSTYSSWAGIIVYLGVNDRTVLPQLKLMLSGHALGFGPTPLRLSCQSIESH